MAIRVPVGYERNLSYAVEWSEGVRPNLEYRPHPCLPVQAIEPVMQDGLVVLAGQFVAVASGYLVPATDTDVSVAYSALDIGRTLNINTGSLVTSADVADGDAFFVSASGCPIGVAPQHYYSNMIEIGAFTNYHRQDKVAVLCKYVIELPYVRNQYSGVYDMAANGALTAGDLVQVDLTNTGTATMGCLGRLAKWQGTAGTLPYVVGRVLKVKTGYPKDFLDRVATVPGLGLDGSGTRGLPANLNVIGNGITAVQSESTTGSLANVAAVYVSVNI